MLQGKKNWTIIEAVLQLEPGNYEEISELMKARKVRRIESQPTKLHQQEVRSVIHYLSIRGN